MACHKERAPRDRKIAKEFCAWTPEDEKRGLRRAFLYMQSPMCSQSARLRHTPWGKPTL